MTKNKMTTKVVISTAILALAIAILPTGNAFNNTEFGMIQAEASTATHFAKSNVNLRTGPSTKDKIVLQIPKNGKVSYISKSGIWYKVKYGTKTGYVHSDYLAKIETVAPETPKTTPATHFAKSNVNLRTGASTKHKIVLQIPKNGKVSYISKSGIWYKVKYGTKTGYVHSDYLAKIEATAPSKYPAPSTDTPGKYVDDILIVNKKYALPSTYNPGVNATAKKALDAMIADAKKQSVTLKITSSYRSYSYQNTLYNNYVKKHGKAQADRFSARPGHSEHQTGLAFDLGGVNQAHWFEESFANIKEGKWLASNAHKYGFHLRYQKGKEDITGYMFEPWHFRYIGEDNATKIKATGKTLEEYLNIPGK